VWRIILENFYRNRRRGEQAEKVWPPDEQEEERKQGKKGKPRGRKRRKRVEQYKG